MLQTVSVIGLGYIGLPTAAMLASRKLRVIGVDVNQHAVDTINQGKIHIVEPELDLLVNAAVTGGYLSAQTKAAPADAFMIAVPTPFFDDLSPDLSYVEAAVKSIAPVLAKGNLVVLESTSPVGTTELVCKWIKESRPDLTLPTDSSTPDLHVAYCPERVLPGKVVHELISNDRIIGGLSAACSAKAKALYNTFVAGELLVTDARTAEMSKLTENAFRDVNIAFANELSLICDKLNINVWELIRMANRHPRVNILTPGAGVGGHCIAVDPWFIVHSAPEQAKIIRTAREVNDFKPEWVLQKVLSTIANHSLNKPSVACFGLAFKPDIDDLRESPALHITNKLADSYNGKVMAVEPNIHSTNKLHANAELVCLEQGLTADIIVILVKHKAFNGVDFSGKTVINVVGE
ncbi:MAG TPA: UDP-N-acetyl-D-mannosamine dehydrogenase [Rheinheimera sp.]|uniref:UDP-N-acetyl-D-mannosamine dehydrogenase n=1 Tax=Rheinheimera sp. TaxID=1869214 RepID=UPI000EE904D9|nr:UDP-N-acetyl-D-mannosamine dehydrogenase [Rheinheimera sp.]HCU66831.1 UDP-N-acetyl-D-mannosamine dehydrogenase [Rheinheimera sp.]